MEINYKISGFSDFRMIWNDNANNILHLFQKRVLFLIAIVFTTANTYGATVYPNNLPIAFDGTLISNQSAFETGRFWDEEYGTLAAYAAEESSLGRGYLLNYKPAKSSSNNYRGRVKGDFWVFVLEAYTLNGNDDKNHEVQLYFEQLTYDTSPPTPHWYGSSVLSFYLNDNALLNARGYDFDTVEDYGSAGPIMHPIPPSDSINMDTGTKFLCLADCFSEVTLDLTHIQFVEFDDMAYLMFDFEESSPIIFQEVAGGYAWDSSTGYFDRYVESTDRITIAPVPLPVSVWLFCSGLIGFFLLRISGARHLMKHSLLTIYRIQIPNTTTPSIKYTHI